MPRVAKKRRFSNSTVYRSKEPHVFHYLSERMTFWMAVLSLFAFVTGNMLGQNGWHVFWASVLGNGLESTITFTGTVAPIAKVPDYTKWSRYGGDVRNHTYREVPQDVLIPLPAWKGPTASDELIYAVDQMGRYDTGRGEGSHPGMDISVPTGTPVLSIANGIVVKSDNDVGGYGIYVMIKHPNAPDPANPSKTTALYSIYAHLSAAVVSEGDIVNKGQQIGASGQTGFATGPHLHFQLDRDEAPWHPYWPFTGSEARDARMTMSAAVNAGLHRERGLEFTMHPMNYVQAYLNVSTVVKASSSSSSPKRLTLQDRKQARLARLGVPKATYVLALNDTPASSSSSSVSSAALPTVAPEGAKAGTTLVPLAATVSSSSSSSFSSTSSFSSPKTPVASIAIRHQGSFTAERARLPLTLELLDLQGKTVTNPASFRIDLRTAYGKAQFFPPFLTQMDFENGKAKIEILPLGQQTVVIQVQPMGSMSKPLVFQR